MELITVAESTALVTNIIGFFSANWVALVVLIGFGVGFKLFRSLVNNGLRGRV